MTACFSNSAQTYNIEKINFHDQDRFKSVINILYCWFNNPLASTYVLLDILLIVLTNYRIRIELTNFRLKFLHICTIFFFFFNI